MFCILKVTNIQRSRKIRPISGQKSTNRKKEMTHMIELADKSIKAAIAKILHMFRRVEENVSMPKREMEVIF